MNIVQILRISPFFFQLSESNLKLDMYLSSLSKISCLGEIKAEIARAVKDEDLEEHGLLSDDFSVLDKSLRSIRMIAESVIENTF